MCEEEMFLFWVVYLCGSIQKPLQLLNHNTLFLLCHVSSWPYCKKCFRSFSVLWLYDLPWHLYIIIL